MAMTEMNYIDGGGIDFKDISFIGSVAYTGGTGYKDITEQYDKNLGFSISNGAIVCGTSVSSVIVYDYEGDSYSSLTGNQRVDITHNGVTTNYNVAMNDVTVLNVSLTSGDTIKFYRSDANGATSAAIIIP